MGPDAMFPSELNASWHSFYPDIDSRSIFFNALREN
jgi:hypothetical protein